MSGVIVSVKGRYAVLLTKNSDFIKVKNKNTQLYFYFRENKGKIIGTKITYICLLVIGKSEHGRY